MTLLRNTWSALLEDFTPSGPREIVVCASDLEAARELLARSTG